MLESSWSLQWAPEKFKKDRHWCAALYQKDKFCLPFISKELLTEDFCLEILSNTHHAANEIKSYWNNLPLNLQNDDFLKKAILYSDLLITFASNELLKSNSFLVEIQKIGTPTKTL